MPIVDFATEVAATVEETARMLEDDPQQCMRDYAPSMLCSKIDGDAVTVKVSPDDERWTDELEQLIRDEVAGHRGATGAACRLVVVRG